MVIEYTFLVTTCIATQDNVQNKLVVVQSFNLKLTITSWWNKRLISLWWKSQHLVPTGTTQHCLEAPASLLDSSVCWIAEPEFNFIIKQFEPFYLYFMVKEYSNTSPFWVSDKGFFILFERTTCRRGAVLVAMSSAAEEEEGHAESLVCFNHWKHLDCWGALPEEIVTARREMLISGILTSRKLTAQLCLNHCAKIWELLILCKEGRSVLVEIKSLVAWLLFQWMWGLRWKVMHL